jgi:hypothetical protein
VRDQRQTILRRATRQPLRANSTITPMQSSQSRARPLWLMIASTPVTKPSTALWNAWEIPERG